MSSNALAIFADIIVFVALPVLVIWLIMRAKINKDNAQKEFMMTALEKNPQINIESLARTLDAGGKSIKEKLINKFTGLSKCRPSFRPFFQSRRKLSCYGLPFPHRSKTCLWPRLCQKGLL